MPRSNKSTGYFLGLDMTAGFSFQQGRRPANEAEYPVKAGMAQSGPLLIAPDVVMSTLRASGSQRPMVRRDSGGRASDRPRNPNAHPNADISPQPHHDLPTQIPRHAPQRLLLTRTRAMLQHHDLASNHSEIEGLTIRDECTPRKS